MKLGSLALAAMSALVFSACGGGGGGAPAIDATPHIKGTVAGTVLKADSDLYGDSYDRDGRTLIVIGGQSAGSPMAAWVFAGVPHQTGTFACGTDAGAYIDIRLSDKRSAPEVRYFADGGDGSSCSVTVTAVSATEVSGTFDATMMENGGSTSIQVTKGSFRVILDGRA